MKIRLLFCLTILTSTLLTSAWAIGQEKGANALIEAANSHLAAAGAQLEDENTQLSEKLQALASQYYKLQQLQAEQQGHYGENHPQVAKVRAEMDHLAQYIRDAKIQIGLLEENTALAEIRQKTQELSKAISKLQPLVEDEAELDKAMKLLKKALAQLDAKSAMKRKAILSTGKLLEGLAKSSENKAAPDLALYEKLLAERNVQLSKMQDQLAQARNKAAEAAAERLLRDKKVYEKLAGQEVEAKTSGVDNRLKKLESDMSDVKAMLSELMKRLDKK